MIKAKRRPVRTKAQYTRERYLTGSVSLLDGYGYRGAKLKPFNYDLAVRQFNSWVYVATMLNANRAAAQPLRLFVRKQSGRTPLFTTRPLTRRQKAYFVGDAQLQPSRYVLYKAATDIPEGYEEVVEQHPLMTLLETVNPWQNGYQLTALRHVYQQLTGNAYQHIVIDQRLGIPSELWVMPAQWVDIVPGERGSGQFVEGYVYGRDTPVRREFKPDEVDHFKYPNPRDLHYGMGKVEAGWYCGPSAAGVLPLNEAMHEHDTALYQNNARPDYAVIIKNVTDGVALKRHATDMNKLLRGQRKAGKLLALGGDTEVVPLGWPPKDMAGRAEMLEEIAGVFGVPMSMLKSNDPNRANAEQGDRGWLMNTIAPMLAMDEQRLNECMLPRYSIEDDAFLAYDNPLPENIEQEHKHGVENVAAGIVTVNERRAELGLPPMKGGDEPRGQPTDLLGGLFRIGTSVGGNGNGGYGVAPIKVLDCYKSSAIARDSRRFVTKGAADDTARDDEAEAPIRRLIVRLAAILGRQLESVRTAMDVAQKDVADDAEAAIKRAEAAIARYERELQRAMAAGLGEVMAGAGKRTIAAVARQAGIDIGVTFNTTNPRVMQFLDDYTPKLARSLNETLAREIQDVVRGGVSEGATYNEIRQRIEDSPAFADDGIANRAEMIARTESARAHVRGQIAGADASGVVTGKRWVGAPDACFVAGSQVTTPRGNVAIERLVVGDFVIGHSGRPCRVTAIRPRWHDGPLVFGPGFAVTPDHWFLTSVGWRSIGEYASKACIGRAVDFLVGKTQNVPAAFAKIVGLPAILCGNLGAGMPIQAIAKHDQFPVRYHKINNPPAVHGYLFSERNAGGDKHRSHSSLDPSAVFVRVDGDDVAVLGTVVPHSAGVDGSAAPGLQERFSASGADARYARPEFVGGAGGALTAKFAGAGPRTAFVIRLPFVGILGTKGFLAPLAGLFGKPRSVSYGAPGDVHASVAAKSGSSLGVTWEYLAYSAAHFACDCASAAAAILNAFPRAVFRRIARQMGLASFGMKTSAAPLARKYGAIIPRLVHSVNAYRGVVYDIEVADDHSFVLSCGLVAHNCSFCEAAAAEFDGRDVGLNDPFYAAGAKLTAADGATMTFDYGAVDGPPLHVNCRCALEFVV